MKICHYTVKRYKVLFNNHYLEVRPEICTQQRKYSPRKKKLRWLKDRFKISRLWPFLLVFKMKNLNE